MGGVASVDIYKVDTKSGLMSTKKELSFKVDSKDYVDDKKIQGHLGRHRLGLCNVKKH